jgi:hypothetical protein
MIMRFQQRHISYTDIKDVILNGEIIKEYSDDKPYPSCLILGHTREERVLRVVSGLTEEKLWLITAYEPDKILRDENFLTRKEGV